MTNNANPVLGQIEDLFKDLVWDSLVKSALTALFVAVPGLAVWPLGMIIRWVVNRYAGQLFQLLRLVVDLKVIAFVNYEHKRAFDNAAVKLKIIALDQGIDSDEFKKARENAKASLAKFVTFGGAAQ